MCQGSGPKSVQVLASWESQAGVVSSVYKEWRVMRDPRWCDGRSNVNGVRHLHSFGSQLNLVKLGEGGRRKMPEVAHRPSPSPPLVPSPTAVLYVSCNCCACCSSGHSRRGQGKRANPRMGSGWRCTADGLAPSSHPHQHRLIASASFGGTVHQQKLKAWLKRKTF